MLVPTALTGRLAAFIALALSAGLAGADVAFAAPVGAVSRSPGTIDVFGRDPSTGQLRQTTFDASSHTWSPWQPRGGALAPGTDISVVSRSPSTLDVFFRGPGGVVQRESFTDGTWSTPITVSTRPANGGPAAVVTGQGVQIFARSQANATLVRHTWNPASGRVKTGQSKVPLAPGTGPGVDSADGRVAQVAATGPSGSRSYITQLNLASSALPEPTSSGRAATPRFEGSPTVTALASGAFVVTGRTSSGNLVRGSRERRARHWPSTWSTIASPPGTQLAGTAPETATYRSRAGTPETLLTFLPAADGRRLLQLSPQSGWITISPGNATLAETLPNPQQESVAPATDAPPTAAAAGPPSPTPTPGPLATPAPAVIPTPTPTPRPPGPSDKGPEPLPEGTIRYFGRTSSDPTWDRWLSPPGTAEANITWLRSKVWRLEMFSPFGNPVTSWFPGGLVYYPLYSIDPATAEAHPDWVLRDASGDPLHAADGSTPRQSPAGNIFNADYRRYQIDRLLALVNSAAYRGLWLDNVNLELGDSGLVRQVHQLPDGTWDFASTIVGALSGLSPSGGYNEKALASSGSFPVAEGCAGGTVPAGETREITDSCWADGISAMVTELRARLPASKELLTNTPWYRFERNVETYNFIDDTVPPNVGRPVGGLPTAAGKDVVDATTYVNFEGSFWTNGDPSGYGPGGTTDIAGHADHEYTTDAIMRWMDAIHARGKGVVVEDVVAGDLALLSPGAVRNGAETPLRINEYNLAGELMVSNGRDGVGNFNLTDQTWPAITGTGGTGLFDMALGSAAPRPTNTKGAAGGATGRGVATVGTAGNRLWVRAFQRPDGKHAFVLLSEPGTGTDQLDGSSVTYTVPANGCTDMTRAASTPATYRTLNPATSFVTLRPRAAMFVLCN